MIRIFCFSKNVIGQNWSIKEQADNLVQQLREILSGIDNFLIYQYLISSGMEFNADKETVRINKNGNLSLRETSEQVQLKEIIDLIVQGKINIKDLGDINIKIDGKEVWVEAFLDEID